MKITCLSVALILIFMSVHTDTLSMIPNSAIKDQHTEKDSVLRHVVLFKFKASTPAEEIEKVEASFVDLKSKIPQILSLEWGINNSPEALDKGFTHCFFLTFSSEEDRDTYLPHPDHKAFGNMLGPILDDVLVVDYWSN